MNKINSATVSISEKKLLSISELCVFLGVGKNLAKRLGTEAGARRAIGSRVLYDRATVEQYVDKIGG